MLIKRNKIVYNKLVRDRIPEIIAASGKKANYRVLTDDEYKQALKYKLLEEVNELLAAQTKREMQEEIADIKEVIASIHRAFKLGKPCYNPRFIKAIKKGCFAKKIFLESVEEIIV